MRVVVTLLFFAIAMGGCAFGLTSVASSTVCMGPYEAAAVCDEFIALARPALQGTRLDEPSAVVVGPNCPPNARCMPSALGGDTVAVVAVWPDGHVAWATMDLPVHWRDALPGPVVPQSGEPPEHLFAMIS